ncbi:MAG: cytidine deaminase [Cellvibrionaceae bacterium]|jgi:cytidine deaminase
MNTRELLIQKATDIRPMAYTPYSNFWVGAALITENGEIFTGVNFENASFGLTICAERNAIGTMVTGGQKTIKALAVATENGVTPCGACRQVMLEFARENYPVYIVNTTTGIVRDTTLNQLIPDAFDSSQLPG